MKHDYGPHDVEYILFVDRFGLLLAQDGAVPRSDAQPFPDGPLAIYKASHPAADLTPETEGTPEGEWDGLTLEPPTPTAKWPWMWFEDE
jgi:hypothetical protein